MKASEETRPKYNTSKSKTESVQVIDKDFFTQEIVLSLKKDNQDNELKKIKVSSSFESASLMRKIFPIELNLREAFICAYLNRQNYLIGYQIISIGGYAGTVVDSKLIYSAALLCGASAIVICHNHPSGLLSPSKVDLVLTEKIKEGGKLLSIDLLDHIILTEHDYYSFADSGVL